MDVKITLRKQGGHFNVTDGQALDPVFKMLVKMSMSHLRVAGLKFQFHHPILVFC